MIPGSRIERYLAMKRDEARVRAGKMLAKHGSLWLNAVAAVRDDAIGTVIETNSKTDIVTVELFNGSGKVRFQSTTFYGFPAADLRPGDCVAKVPS